MLKVKLSLEALLLFLGLLPLALAIALAATILVSISASVAVHFLSLFLISVVFIALYIWVRNKVVDTLRVFALQIESMRNEDYNHFSIRHFQRGVMTDLLDELELLSAELQQKRTLHAQNIFMIYRLIDDISSPIMVLNKNRQLVQANEAFIQIFARHWSDMHYWHIDRIGITQFESGDWQFKDNAIRQRWQIKASELRDYENHYQLLICTDIHQAVQQARLQSWQDIVRVLKHEIGNSLAPIKSMAETLKTIDAYQSSQAALDVIVERSEHLQEFVANYSRLAQPLAVDKVWHPASEFIDNLKAIFPDVEFSVQGASLRVLLAPALMEQVLINLLKNAVEASEGAIKVSISFQRSAYEQEIKVQDNGTGIHNPDNLFVPFYTTKPTGQGIGLSLCQQIVAGHGGTIELQNKVSSAGAVATIRLPLIEE